MAQIGETLRAAREARGLSLEEAEVATRIRARFLEALEKDDHSALGGEVYVRGFVRNYALFLGISPEPLLAQLGPRPVPLPTPTTTPPRYMSVPLESNPLPLGRILLMLTSLLLLGALGLTLWGQPTQRDALLTRLGMAGLLTSATLTPAAPVTGGEATPLPTQGVLSGTPTREPSRSVTPSPDVATPVPTATLPPRTPTPDPNQSATPTQAPLPSGVVVQVQIVADSWVRVFVDGRAQPEIERTLRVGESYEWVGEQAVSLRAGNAGGIRITLNGQDIGLLGGAGEVVERRWERDPNGGPPILINPQTSNP